jgi:hypothetical protein
MKRVINFSGGKTSALMTILLKPTEDDIVLFCDTKHEHKLTYKFIDDFERYEGIKVHRATYTHWKSPGLEGFDALTNWKKHLPNRMKRLCTTELKINVARRYLRPLIGMRFEQYIGFRFDEPNRVKNYKNTYAKVVTKFPLYDRGITKEMVNQYWLTKPYNLEIPSILGNCDLCFLKGKDNIIKIMAMYPELADKWIEHERRANVGRKKKDGTFFPDVSYAGLLKIALSQKTLFDVDDLTPAYNCSCTL